MTTPRPHRKRPLDHVAEALMHLQNADAALERIDDRRVSAAARALINTLRERVAASQSACADTMEELLPGGVRVMDSDEVTHGVRKEPTAAGH